MAETDLLVEDGRELWMDPEDAEAMTSSSGSGKRFRFPMSTVVAVLGCVGAVGVLIAHERMVMRAPSTSKGSKESLERDMMQLSAKPSSCSAYTDCAAMTGDCCPTSTGMTLGCCNSPLLDAAVSLEAGPPPLSMETAGECRDTPNWANGYWQCMLHGYNIMHGCTATGISCRGYEVLGFCAHGQVVPGKEWAATPMLGNPQENCCACGKTAEEVQEEEEMLPPTNPPLPITPQLPPITPELPSDLPSTISTPEPAAPLGGGAAPNGTQGEPTGSDCASNPGCSSLGMQGECCPTADGTLLGCCGSTDLAAGPALLPKAEGPGPLMTFYMYRVASDEDYPINGANMANLAGDMWYLHNEVVQHCPRKFNMERLMRFKVTMRATPELYGQGRNFDQFVAFDEAKCTVPLCQERHWDPFGYVVGCQPNNAGQVAVPGSPAWYSLPGTCPNKFYYEKTEECNTAEPGGECPTSEVKGTRDCTYYFERAGEIRLDDLTGLQGYNSQCQTTGMREFDETTDAGVGTKFWNGKSNAEAGSRRLEMVKELFAQKYPTMPKDLEDPACDVQG